MKNLLLLTLLCLSLVTQAQKKSGTDLDKKVKEYDAYAQQALKQWDVVGASVAVVKDGKVIYIKSYGVRDLNTGKPVTNETLFSIGSTTKAMTAVCLGMLVDEGKVNWNDPVSKYLPDFQLYDPFVTRDLKIRDLLLHNSGVGNTDFLWGAMDIPETEILNRMRMVKPSYSLRAGFIYQNVFYIAAGKVIEKASGQSWHEFIQARIFTPLGMTRTASKLKNIKDDNFTKPHFKVNGKMQVIDHTNDEHVGAAGSVWSSIEDMSKWVQCMLDSSKFPSTSSGQAASTSSGHAASTGSGAGRLLKAATWAEMFKPQTFVTESQFYPTAKLTKPNWTTYGFGWFQHDYKGHKVNFHTGSLSGLIALNAQLPDQNLGYYFLGNTDHAEVRHALMYKAFDHFALGGNRDWSTELLELYRGLASQQEKQVATLEGMRVANTSSSLPMEAYAGKYTDPLFGSVVVTLEGANLKFNVNNVLYATMSHWNFDTFYGTWDKAWDGKAVAQFTLSPFGKVEKLNLEGMELNRVE